MISIIIILIFLLLVLLIIFLFYIIIWPHIVGAPYVRTKDSTLKTIFELAQIKPGEVVVDLGSGDGILLIEATKLGAVCIGYEINPFLVRASRKEIKKLGLADQAQVMWQSFWKVNLNQADIILLFGVRHIMPALEKKIIRELKPGARVVSEAFQFPSWSCIQKKDNIWLYKKF